MDDWKDEKLYHYTSFQALEGILDSKKIWLGNLHYMNDRKEMRYFFEKLKNCILEDLPEETETIKTMFSEQQERLKNRTAYAFSLSELPNSASQWDRYADGGRGVCIVFSADILNQSITNQGILQHVYYLRDLKKHQAKALIEHYILTGELGSAFESIEDIFNNAWACSIAYKHPSFEEEKEVRICSLPFYDTGMYHGSLEFRVGSKGLREYLPIRLYSESERIYKKAIEEIIIGPNAGIDKNMFYRYLKSKGVDTDSIDVSISDCPLK